MKAQDWFEIAQALNEVTDEKMLAVAPTAAAVTITLAKAAMVLANKRYAEEQKNV